MDFNMIMKLAGLGLLVGVIVIVLELTDRKDIAKLTVIAAVVVALYIVVQAVADLFSHVRSVFQIY